MTEIYQRASKVLIWLGEPEFDDDEGELMAGLPAWKPDYRPNRDWSAGSPTTFLIDDMLGSKPSSVDDIVIKAFMFLALVANGIHITELPYFPQSHFTKNLDRETMLRDRALSSLPGLTVGSLDLDQFEAWSVVGSSLLLMMTRKYWTRVWTLQEAVLGQRATLHYGRHSVALEVLIKAE